MIPHGLGGVPDFIIIKTVSAGGTWHTLHSSISGFADGYLRLNENVAFIVDSNSYPTTPTTHHVHTGLTVMNGNVGSGDSAIMYCWKAVSGVSAFGTYEGDGGSARTITTGFQPKFVIVKYIDATGRWIIQDSFRDSGAASGNILYPNLNYAESDHVTHTMNFDATGFSFTAGSTLSHINANGNTFIYAAFA